MWVQPTLTSGSSLGRTKWKCMQQSLHFLLQQGPSEVSEDGVSYRIVTRSFPTYIIACSESLPPSLDHFRFLHEEFLEQMPIKKPNELIKNIKAYYLNFPDYQPPTNEGAGAEEAETAKLNARIEKALSRHISLSELMSFAEESEESEGEAPPSPALSADSVDSFKFHQRAKRQDFGATQEKAEEHSHKIEAHTSPNLDIDWAPESDHEYACFTFPFYERLVCAFNKMFGLPDGVREIRYDHGFYGFSRRLIQLLCYPSIYLEDGTLKSSFQFLSEVQATNTRRKFLFGLTVYSFAMHFCSLDSFYFLLFLSNCALLFFMRDTFSVNFTLSNHSRVSQGSATTVRASEFKGEPKPQPPNEISTIEEQPEKVELPLPTKTPPRSRAQSRRHNSDTASVDQLASLPPSRPHSKEMRRPNSSDRLGALNQLTSASPSARPSLPNLRANHVQSQRPANDNTLSVIFPPNN